MALDFPSSPNVGDQYGRWQWNGTSWVSAPAVSVPYLPLTGGTLSGPLNVDANTAIDADLNVTGGITADHVTTTGTSLDVAGTATIRGDLTVLGDADFDADLTIKGSPVATEADIDAVKNLGLYAGAFATYAAVPTNTSAFPHLTQNDFITVHADENHNDDTTRYVASNIAANGDITWTYDITYSTDVSGKMDLVPTATAGNIAVFDAAGQVEDGGALDAASLQFRPMTPDLHNWIPNGTVGLFVGEGNPTNSPPGLPNGPGYHPPITGITKWRFICSSDGDAMTMTATSIGTAPNRTRMFQKMKKAGDTWDYRWVEYANEYNLKMAGRNTRLVNSRPQDDYIGTMWPPTNATERMQARFTGYRPSHAGLIHTGRFGNTMYAHTMPKIDGLPIALLPDWYGSQNMNTQGGESGNSWNALYVDLKRRSNTGHPKRRRYLRIPAPAAGARYYRFNFNVFPAFPNPQPTNLDVLQATVVLDFRLVNNANARWLAWDHGGTPMTHTFKTGIGFRKSGGNGWESWFRIGHFYPPDMTAAQMQNPSGQVFKIDFDYSPRFDLCFVSIYCHPSTLQRWGLAGT